jgi:hypothetical protein
MCAEKNVYSVRILSRRIGFIIVDSEGNLGCQITNDSDTAVECFTGSVADKDPVGSGPFGADPALQM